MPYNCHPPRLPPTHAAKPTQKAAKATAARGHTRRAEGREGTSDPEVLGEHLVLVEELPAALVPRPLDALAALALALPAAAGGHVMSRLPAT